MLKKLTLTLFCAFAAHCLLAQTKETTIKAYRHELGLNVTNLLTDLLGNNNRTDPGSYLITYKRVNGDKALRLGATLSFTLNNQTTSNFSTELRNENFQFRIGREKRGDLSSRLQYYYGFDGIVGYKSEQSIGSTTTAQLIQTDKNLIAGGGPVLGFQFAIYDRLLVGTEGSLYAAFNNSTVDYKQLGGFGSVLPSKKSLGVNVQTNLPKFLFLILKF